MAYSAKNWVLGDPITESDLERIENGIAAVTTAFEANDTLQSILSELSVPTDQTITGVTANINTYYRHGTYRVIADVTPAINGRLLINGHLTLKHSASGNPDIAMAFLSDTGTLIKAGPMTNRYRDSTACPVTLGFSYVVNVTAGVRTQIHLGVSSSIAGTITLVGGRCYVDTVLVPR